MFSIVPNFCFHSIHSLQMGKRRLLRMDLFLRRTGGNSWRRIQNYCATQSKSKEVGKLRTVGIGCSAFIITALKLSVCLYNINIPIINEKLSFIQPTSFIILLHSASILFLPECLVLEFISF